MRLTSLEMQGSRVRVSEGPLTFLLFFAYNEKCINFVKIILDN